jgi:hypothetical protein
MDRYRVSLRWKPSNPRNVLSASFSAAATVEIANRIMPFPDGIARGTFLLVALSVAVTACGEGKSKEQYVLKEVIDVQGTCSEDHVRQRDNYAGQIVRWQAIDTGKISTYGFLSKSGDVTQHVLDEVTHPTVYHTPERISFLEIDIDTDQPKWVLHGVSDREEDSSEPTRGYNSTCDLEVVKRGMEIRNPSKGDN